MSLFRFGKREYRDGVTKPPMKTTDDSFFVEPLDPRREARELAVEAISRLLIWMADCPTLNDRGLRATVALYCLRPDLVGGQTLERIGALSGHTRQHVHTLADNFRRTTGLDR